MFAIENGQPFRLDPFLVLDTCSSIVYELALQAP